MKLLLSDFLGRIHVIPDSAIGRDSQPWFLPDFGTDWRGYEAVAVRISRLGKGIAPKFADRYVDAITTLWVAEADNVAAIDFMDGRVVTGKWLPLEPDANISQHLAMIVEVSKYATLKNGDIIAIAIPNSENAINVGKHISNPYLNFNIK